MLTFLPFLNFRTDYFDIQPFEYNERFQNSSFNLPILPPFLSIDSEAICPKHKPCPEKKPCPEVKKCDTLRCLVTLSPFMVIVMFLEMILVGFSCFLNCIMDCFISKFIFPSEIKRNKKQKIL